MKLYIIRHGQTSWNKERLLQGRTDIDLNEEGINQAKEQKKIIDNINIDLCLTSPLKRTFNTSTILLENKIPIIKEELLIERNFGDFEGKTIDMDLIAKQWDYHLNDSNNNIESIKECLDRAKKFLLKIKNTYNDKNLLIVSHGAFIKALHFNLIGYNEFTNFLSFNPKNCELNKYEL